MPIGESRKAFEFLVDEASGYVMENARKQGNERKRLAVHCRAGIGRTGTTLALINAVITIQEQLKSGVQDPDLSLFSIVRRLREQRIWMVQTEDQFAYTYDFIRSKYSNIQ